MPLDDTVRNFINTFQTSEIVILSLLSSQLTRQVKQFNGIGNGFYLLLSIYVLWIFTYSPIQAFLNWLWFRLPIWQRPDEETLSKIPTFGHAKAQHSLLKVMSAISYVLLYSLFDFSIELLTLYWVAKQWGVFDVIWFLFLLIRTLYTMLECLAEISF
jgi:hypothetical protein